MGELSMKVKAQVPIKVIRERLHEQTCVYVHISYCYGFRKIIIISTSSNLMIIQTIAKHDLRKVKERISFAMFYLIYNHLITFSRKANKSSLSELFVTFRMKESELEKKKREKGKERIAKKAYRKRKRSCVCDSASYSRKNNEKSYIILFESKNFVNFLLSTLHFTACSLSPSFCLTQQRSMGVQSYAKMFFFFKIIFK